MSSKNTSNLACNRTKTAQLANIEKKSSGKIAY